MKITHNKNIRLTAKRKALKDAAAFYAKLLKINNYDFELQLNFNLAG